MLTRGHGVVRVLAKGSRRPKAPYSGGLELLTVAEATFIVRAGSELALLTAWDVREFFPALRSVLEANRAAMYIADLTFSFVRDHDPHPVLYEATVAALRAMRGAGTVGPAVLEYQWRLLDECGFRPELESDVATGEALGPGTTGLMFSPALGGLVREATAAPSAGAGAWRVRGQTVDLLRAMAAGRLEAGGAGGALDRANRLLASYARHVLGAEPPAMTAMFGTGLAR